MGRRQCYFLWAGIHSSSWTTLHNFKEKVDAATYLNDILGGSHDPLFSGQRDMYTFQKDNAINHVARAHMKFLDKQPFPDLRWPMYSHLISHHRTFVGCIGHRIPVRHIVNGNYVISRLRNEIVCYKNSSSKS